MTEENTIRVYAIRNDDNGKLYIGSSSDFDQRITHHISQLNSHCHPVEAMQAEYDENRNNFSVATLFEGDYSDAVHLIERLYMSLFKTREPQYGYNSNDPSNNISIDNVRFQPITKKRRNPKNKNVTLREWLYNARKANGMTQLDMAKALGVSESYYSYVENGVRQQKMDIPMAVKISSILGIPLTEIVESEKLNE